MVAHLLCGDRRILCPQPQRRLWLGAPVLSVELPRDGSRRRLERLGRGLRRLGVRRVIPDEGVSRATAAGLGLPEVDPLPVCRAMGARLALALLGDVPPRSRRVALWGGDPGTAAPIARELCPYVGALELELDRGGEGLARALAARYGVVCVPPAAGEAPQVALELSPGRGERRAGTVLRLWGTPQLGPLALGGPRGLPPPPAGLELLELLWETGRITRGEVTVTWLLLDRSGQNTYNTVEYASQSVPKNNQKGDRTNGQAV